MVWILITFKDYKQEWVEVAEELSGDETAIFEYLMSTGEYDEIIDIMSKEEWYNLNRDRAAKIIQQWARTHIEIRNLTLCDAKTQKNFEKWRKSDAGKGYFTEQERANAGPPESIERMIQTKIEDGYREIDRMDLLDREKWPLLVKTEFIYIDGGSGEYRSGGFLVRPDRKKDPEKFESSFDEGYVLYKARNCKIFSLQVTRKENHPFIARIWIRGGEPQVYPYPGEPTNYPCMIPREGGTIVKYVKRASHQKKFYETGKYSKACVYGWIFK